MQLGCITKGMKLKKILLGSLFLPGVLFATTTTLSYSQGVKDFENSMTKKDGAKIKNINISHKVPNHLISVGYQSDNVDRQHFITNVLLPSLDIEKYNDSSNNIFFPSLLFDNYNIITDKNNNNNFEIIYGI